MRLSSRLLVLVALALLASACADTPTQAALTPTSPDEIAEVSWDATAIDEFAHAGGFSVSPLFEVPSGATRVGGLLTLDLLALDAPPLEVRGMNADGEAGPWLPLETTWSEADQRVVTADLSEPAYAIELRAPLGAADVLALVTLSALVPEPTVDVPTIGMAREYLRSELSAAGIRPRSAWGARGTRCTSGDSSKNKIAIHHTVSPADGDPGVRLRGIQAYHMDSRGWCDVGYHFLVTVDGQVWEGRPMNLLGAHVGGHNTGNIGVSFVGCFHTSSCGSFPPNVPPDAMIGGAGSAVRTLADLHGISINSSTVKGHRDHAGASTSCPGDHLHSRLGRIRSAEAVLPDFAASYVDQSFPLAREPFDLTTGEVVAGYIEMRNDGSETWRPGETFLGTTEPRDGASPLAGPDWISPSRAATIDAVVAPGETGRFAFSVMAPDDAGDYPQYFSVVQEGVAWFSDPGQGGPRDDLLQVRVTAVAGAPTDPGPGPGPTDPPPTDPPIDPPVMGDAGAGRPSAPGGPTTGHLSGGCATAGSGADASPLALFLAVLALLARPCRRTSGGG